MFNAILKKLNKKVELIAQARHFSVFLMLFHMIPQRLLPASVRNAALKWKHGLVLNYLRGQQKETIAKYKNAKVESVCLKPDDPIWVCWFQGEDAMPPVVKACYASLKKFAQSHPVVLITNENLFRYVQLPEHIMRKVRDGKISLTHFSDIIRVALLSTYGGIWIDSTMYFTAPLNWPETPFHTLAWQQEFSDEISFSRWTDFCESDSVIRWSSSLLSSGKGGNLLFPFVRDCFFAYLKKEDTLIDYFFTGYCIEIAYEEFPNIKKIIDGVPLGNRHIAYLENHFADDFDKVKLEAILSETSIFKLTYKLDLFGIANSDALSENSIYRKIVDGTFLRDLGR